MTPANSWHKRPFDKSPLNISSRRLILGNCPQMENKANSTITKKFPSKCIKASLMDFVMEISLPL